MGIIKVRVQIFVHGLYLIANLLRLQMVLM